MLGSSPTLINYFVYDSGKSEALLQQGFSDKRCHCVPHRGSAVLAQPVKTDSQDERLPGRLIIFNSLMYFFKIY